MAITWTDVAALDATLSSVPSAAQTAYLADAYALLDATRWGSKLDLAVKYFCAHLGALSLRGGGGAIGPISGQILGDATIFYAVHPATVLEDPYGWGSTIWGQKFKLLMRTYLWAVVT